MSEGKPKGVEAGPFVTHPTKALAELARKSRSTKQAALVEVIPNGAGDKVGYWLTPPEIMDKLQAEFDFNYDACPFPRPPGFDGIKEPWGSRTYCNPPFKGPKMDWARKAVAEHEQGNLVVLIFGTGNLSHICDMMPPEVEVRLIPPFYWLNPDGSPQKTPYSAFLFILRGKPLGARLMGTSPMLADTATTGGRNNGERPRPC